MAAPGGPENSYALHEIHVCVCKFIALKKNGNCSLLCAEIEIISK